jgi:hypothetical protein
MDLDGAAEARLAMRRSAWILLGVLAVVILFWYLLRKGTVSVPAGLRGTATPTLAASEFLFSTEQGTVNGIKIVGNQGNSVHIRRGQGGSWLMLEPVEVAADPAVSESAASQAAALKILTYVDPGTDPAVVGLDKPAYTLTLETSRGDLVFLIGKPTATGSGYFVGIPGGRVAVVSKFGVDALAVLLSSPPYAQTPTPQTTETAPPVATRSPSATP